MYELGLHYILLSLIIVTDIHYTVHVYIHVHVHVTLYRLTGVSECRSAPFDTRYLAI